MPRKPRELVPGGVYHVYARANRKEPLFVDDDDRRRYLRIWESVVEHLRWRWLAFCLMDNHVHHLVEIAEPDLDAGVRLAHGAYGRYFNDVHGHAGHVFQGRFGSTRAESTGALWYFAAYVVLNPVRAGMCARPEEHPWSSHPAAIGSVAAPRRLDTGRLLSYYDADGSSARERYGSLVEAIRVMGAAGFEPATARV